ncbi:NAD(P)H nitroreductase [Nocardia sp. NPDC052112]|uniref:NAD(P)H nitroreductase n=1 Tax=Nocardia sp. NPDC052112 TaxID=3155646 RepID=UPI003424B5B5
MDHGLPDDSTVKTALALAVRAPSVHNVQPWRWRIDDRYVHLYLDPTPTPISTDPEQRDLVLSCGAALHHLRIAFAALGWSAVVHRLPNPVDPNHLAAVELVRHRPTPLDIALSAVISTRQTDRRHYSSWPIPHGYLGLVNERAAALGATVTQARDRPRDVLIETMRTAAARPHEPQAREFASPASAGDAHEPDYAELLMISTSADDRLSRLRAGEAISAVLLTATNIGLATCLLTEPLERADLRRRVRVEVLDELAHPQAVLRIGWPPTSALPLPMTPRRSVDDVLDPFESAVAS